MKISHDDWILLSEYLDQELSPQESDRLETRLQSEEALAAALQHLERTRTLIRSAPRFTAPRDFTLTADQVGESRSGGWWRRMDLYTWASAAAALLLVAVLILDYGNLILSPPLTQVAAPARQEEVIAPEVQENLAAGSEEGPAEEERDVVKEMEEPKALDEKTTAEEERDAPQEESAELMAAPSPSPEPEPTQTILPPPPAERPEGEGRDLGRPDLTSLEVLLAVIALGFGAAAVLRRRGQ